MQEKKTITETSDNAGLISSTFDALDFQTIRERLADYTNFFITRQMALDIEPSFDASRVEELLQETAEGLLFLNSSQDIIVRAVPDVGSYIRHAELEGVLTGTELLSIRELIEDQHRVKNAFSAYQDRLPRLASIARLIPDLDDLSQRISRSIGDRGEVLDSATPSLGMLRSQVRHAYQRVAAALERILQSSTGKEALQDQVISVRGDRLVVQVKREMRHKVPGIVHDASNTGATLFIEPFSTVELCNEWRELALEEERETLRVLQDLSGIVGAVGPDLRLGIDMTAKVDFILARARYSIRLQGISALKSSHLPPSAPYLQLIKARHPLLGGQAVPIDFHLGPEWRVAVITGPNTGGKTVAMKTVGLLSLMFQSGLYIPAEEGSYLPVFTGVYADVGDQQSIQGSVSTFGSHMKTIIGILANATTDSLVLLDELGTSTNPEEGAALAKAILADLAQKGITSIATTHHRSVAAFAETTNGMMNASVELDIKTLRPTYHLTIGVPGRSYAMSIAEQMGLPHNILENARSLMETQYLRFEDWLNELQKERDRLRESREEAEKAKIEAEATKKELETKIRDFALEREDLLSAARSGLTVEYEEVRKKLRRAEAAALWGAPSERLSEARKELESAKRGIHTIKQEETPKPEEEMVEVKPLSAGDVVFIRGFNVQGVITSIPSNGPEAEVAVGGVHLRLDTRRLTRIDAPAMPIKETITIERGPSLSSMELDLRGERAEAALIKVEDFLDRAVRDGLSSVRIIHGRGTGALRQAIRELLEHHPLVRSYAPEPRERGGDGVTLVNLT